MAIHPSRAALFETLVINEFLKRRFNVGLTSNLYFWRDNAGVEVDLILEEGAGLRPVEIKSGQTVQDDFFTGLRKWLNYAQQQALEPTLVYGGDDNYTRSGVAVKSWKAL